MGQFGTVFSPFRFHHANALFIAHQGKARFFPKITHRKPQFFGGTGDIEPHLVARTFDLNIGQGQWAGQRASIGFITKAQIVGADGASRHIKAFVAGNFAQVGRDFQRFRGRRLALVFVIDFIGVHDGATCRDGADAKNQSQAVKTGRFECKHQKVSFGGVKSRHSFAWHFPMPVASVN